MSTSIEQRVVQMRFDNKQFESGVAQSMSTLDKLKAKLNFKGATQGFEDIQRAADKVNLQTIGDQADKVGIKFDALAVVAVTALQRMTNAAINAGTSMVKGLSVDQITAGWTKYEQKTGSVQTIMNATGKSIDEVNKYLDKLMWFSDETSYGFNDMTAAIGQLTSAGGNIDKLVPMVMGIANATAFAGKGVNEFSRSIYNLNQSYSSGALKYMDWKSLELAGVASKQLKEVFIEVGEELDRIDKGAVTIANFGETLKSDWANTEVMEKAFGRFGEMTEKAYEMVHSGMVDTASEAYEILSQTYTGYSIVAAKAAQEAKSFSEAIDATKDAVSSGWMKTFEIIFGNYEEAKKLWTDLANTMWDIFASGADARNEMLQWWKDIGGRTAMLKTISKAFSNLTKVIDALKSAFTDIFPPITFQQLFDATLAVKKFVYQLELSDEAVNTLRVAFKAILLPIKAVVTVLEIAGYWFGVAALNAFKFIDSILAIPSKVNALEKPLRKLFGDERYNRIAEAFSKILKGLGDVLGVAGKSAGDLMSAFVSFTRSSIINAIQNLSEALRPLGGWILDRVVDGIEAIANADYSKILDWANSGIASLRNGFSGLLGLVQNGVDSVKNFFSQFNINSPLDLLKGLFGAVNEFRKSMWEFIKSLGGEEVVKGVTAAANRFGNVIVNLANAVKDFLSLLSPGKILVFSFGLSLVYTVTQIGKAFKAFSEIGDSVSGMFKSVGGVFDAIKDRIKPNLMQKISASIIQFAVALTILSGALYLISKIDPDRLWSSFGALSSLIGVFSVFSAMMVVFNKTLVKTPEMANNLMKLGVALIAMSASIAILSGALYVVSKIDIKGIGTKLLIMGGAIATLIGASVIVGKHSKDLAKSAVFIVAFAGSMLLIARSLKILGEIDLTDSIGNVAIVLSVMAALAVISRIMTRTTKTIGSHGTKMTSGMQGITGLVLNLVVLAGVLKVLSMMDTANLVMGLINMIPVFGALIAVAAISRIAGKESTKMGSQFLAISAAVLILSFGMERIGSIDQGIIDRAMGVIIRLMGMFALLELVAKVGKSSSVKMGGTFLGMASAILILGLAIDYIGRLSPEAAAQGTAVVAAVLGMFAILMAASALVGSSKGTITAMTISIGLLVASLALLTLIDYDELMGSAKALGLVLVAFGISMAGVAKLKMGSAIGSMLVLLAAVSILGLAFKYLKDVDSASALQQAEGIGIVLVALGGAMALLRRRRGENDVALSTVLTMGIVLAEMSAMMLALSLMPAGENLIEKAGAISIIVLALSGAMRILDKTKAPDGIVQTLIVMAGMLAGATIVLAILTGLPADDGVIKKATALGIILVAMAGVMAIISSIGLGLSMLGSVAGPALIGALAAEGIILSLIGLISLVGVAFGHFGWLESGLAKAEEIFPRIGTVIGSFIGNIVGGIVGGVAGGAIEAFGSSLSRFAENVQGFLNLKVSQDTVDSIGRLASVAAAITGVEFLESIARFGKGDSSLAVFGQQLADFGPYFASFAQSISGIPIDAVNASATCLEALSSVLANIPTEGGLLGMMFGTTSLESFATGLSTLAGGISAYASVIETSGVDSTTIEKTNSLTKTLIELANKVPKTGGLVSFLGAHDIGKFGEQLASFGESMGLFMAEINKVEIDEEKVSTVTNCGDMLVSLANKVPKTGALVDFLGAHDIGKFGDQLVVFADGIKRFFQKLYGVDIDQDIVNASKLAGDTMVHLANSVPKTGALLTFFGAHDIGAFGDQIGAFGAGISSFFTAIHSAGIDQDQVELAKNAGIAFTEIADAVGTNTGISTLFENTSLETFGQQIGGLGSGMATYYNNISGIAWDAVSNSITQINRILDLAPRFGTVNADTLGSFKEFLTGLAKASIRNFSDAFKNSEQDISNVIYTTINNAISSAKKWIESDEAGYSFVVDAIVNGLKEQAYMVDDEGRAIANRFLEVIRNSKPLFEEAGRVVTESLVYSLDVSFENSYSRIVSIVKKLIQKVHDAFGIDGRGYSTEFYEVGRLCAEGYAKGIERNQGVAFEAVYDLGRNIIARFRKAMKMHSPPKEIEEAGELTPKGYADGVHKTAEKAYNAVEDLGENIIEEFEDTLDIQNGVSLEGYDLGELLDLGIGTGLDKSDYAYKAAATKADGILDIFKERFSNISDTMSVLDQEFELWATMNPVGSYSDGVNTYSFGQGKYTQKQFELLQTKLELQAEQVNMANASYQANLAKFGEGATATKQAYSTYLEAQITMANMAQSMQQMQIQNQETFKNYAQMLGSVYGGLSEMGFSDEEIKKSVADQTGWANMNAAAQGTIEDMMTTYTQQASNVQELVAEAMQSMNSTAQSSGKQAGTSAMQSFGQAAQEAAPAAAETIGKAVTQAVDGGSDLAKKSFEGTMSYIVEGGVDGLTSNLPGLKEAFTTGIGDMLNAGEKEAEVESPSKRTYRDGVYIIEGLVDGLEEAMPMSIDAATEVVSSTLTVFTDSAQQYPSVGQNMMTGLANGIAAGASAVINAAVQVATAALAATQAALGIHSPSRVFYKIGQMIDQGLSNGILDDYGIVDGSISKIVDRMTQDDLTIRPVIDMSGVDEPMKEWWEKYQGSLVAFDAAGNLIPIDNNLAINAARSKYDTGTTWAMVDADTMKWIRDVSHNTWEFEKMDDFARAALSGLKAAAESGQFTKDSLRNAPTYSITQNISSPTPANPAEISRQTNNAMGRLSNASKNAIHSAGGSAASRSSASSRR